MSIIVVRTDASRGDEAVGLGYHISGAYQEEGNHIMTGRFSSMDAEFYALVRGFWAATNYAELVDECIVYSDAEPMVEKMRGNAAVWGKWEERKQSVDWLLTKFDAADVRWCSRVQNQRAHELAKQALYTARDRKI